MLLVSIRILKLKKSSSETMFLFSLYLQKYLIYLKDRRRLIQIVASIAPFNLGLSFGAQSTLA
jgi:hypothetical protein